MVFRLSFFAAFIISSKAETAESVDFLLRLGNVNLGLFFVWVAVISTVGAVVMISGADFIR
jgi:hypothetical protein